MISHQTDKFAKRKDSEDGSIVKDVKDLKEGLKPVRNRREKEKDKSESDLDELQKVLHNGFSSEDGKSAGSLPGQRIRKRLSVGKLGCKIFCNIHIYWMMD